APLHARRTGELVRPSVPTVDARSPAGPGGPAQRGGAGCARRGVRERRSDVHRAAAERDARIL
ncbi:MAG: hypothetical protein AVDCRST_MAG53-369, partial [uncultured Solirubrobacteraceae bacterium]